MMELDKTRRNLGPVMASDDQPEPAEEPSKERRLDAFTRDLEGLINRHSIENLFDIPDFLLAQYLRDHLCVLAAMSRRRDEWFDFKPFGGKIVEPTFFWFKVADPRHTGFFIEHNLGTSNVTFEFFEADDTPILGVDMDVGIGTDGSGDVKASIISLLQPIPKLAKILVRVVE